MPQSTQCRDCKHYHLGDCEAFPDGIPIEIFTGLFDHDDPYPGDNGIRFELTDWVKAIEDEYDDDDSD